MHLQGFFGKISSDIVKIIFNKVYNLFTNVFKVCLLIRKFF